MYCRRRLPNMHVKIVAVTEFIYEGRAVAPREILSVPQRLAENFVRNRVANYYTLLQSPSGRRYQIERARNIAAFVESPDGLNPDASTYSRTTRQGRT